ncbi:hypothetical protein PN4B1_48960 [Paenibacillus naphthalenovorans]|nr:hypothetical protein PN4B1_48960 [Paenibacillus naphthalenovorans]
MLREEQTVNEIAGKYELSPVMLSRWKAEFLERASMVFGRETKEAEKIKRNYEDKQEQLEKLVGQLTLEVNWLKKKIWSLRHRQEIGKPWWNGITGRSASSAKQSCWRSIVRTCIGGGMCGRKRRRTYN